LLPTDRSSLFIVVRLKTAIPAADKATFMKVLTNEAPTPLLHVKGKPILEHLIAALITAGRLELFIFTGIRAEGLATQERMS
jgi:NDP-sugar pyrophosphorylase family protein